MHELFGQRLSRYCVREELIEAFASILLEEYHEINKEGLELAKGLIGQLRELNKKIDDLEESRYVLKEMNHDTFLKFQTRYNKEMENITEELSKCKQSISNPDEALKDTLLLSSKFPVVWGSSDIGKKEKLQKLVFPEGIISMIAKMWHFEPQK